MVNIFAGLEKFGVNPESASLFEDKEAEKEKQKQEAAASAPPEVKEEELLFERTYECPICDEEFKVKTVKNGKAKSLGVDIDLRAKYEGIDMVKYDVLACPHCGFAILSRYLKTVTPTQRKLVREKISGDFKGLHHDGPIYTYEQAMERYQLTLANAVVKGAKASEKAYICLKSGWLVRGMAENLELTDPNYEELSKKYAVLEGEYIKNAMEGFVVARQKEAYPMCGMDEYTVDYLIAALAIECKSYDIASKLISTILASTTTPPRIKEKARDLKEIVIENKNA
ncbi:MAG: DUF2225 domain-containing protein [Eubacteriales bacterium]